MAGYECSLCDGAEQATLLITPLTGGETMAVGQGCMGVAFAGMLAGHLGIGADELYDAAAGLAKQAAEAKPVDQSPNGGAPPEAPVKRPRGRPRKPAAAEGGQQ